MDCRILGCLLRGLMDPRIDVSAAGVPPMRNRVGFEDVNPNGEDFGFVGAALLDSLGLEEG